MPLDDLIDFLPELVDQIEYILQDPSVQYLIVSGLTLQQALGSIGKVSEDFLKAFLAEYFMRSDVRYALNFSREMELAFNLLDSASVPSFHTMAYSLNFPLPIKLSMERSDASAAPLYQLASYLLSYPIAIKISLETLDAVTRPRASVILYTLLLPESLPKVTKTTDLSVLPPLNLALYVLNYTEAFKLSRSLVDASSIPPLSMKAMYSLAFAAPLTVARFLIDRPVYPSSMTLTYALLTAPLTLTQLVHDTSLPQLTRTLTYILKFSNEYRLRDLEHFTDLLLSKEMIYTETVSATDIRYPFTIALSDSVSFTDTSAYYVLPSDAITADIFILRRMIEVSDPVSVIDTIFKYGSDIISSLEGFRFWIEAREPIEFEDQIYTYRLEQVEIVTVVDGEFFLRSEQVSVSGSASVHYGRYDAFLGSSTRDLTVVATMLANALDARMFTPSDTVFALDTCFRSFKGEEPIVANDVILLWLVPKASTDTINALDADFFTPTELVSATDTARVVFVRSALATILSTVAYRVAEEREIVHAIETLLSSDFVHVLDLAAVIDVTGAIPADISDIPSYVEGKLSALSSEVDYLLSYISSISYGTVISSSDINKLIDAVYDLYELYVPYVLTQIRKREVPHTILPQVIQFLRTYVLYRPVGG